MEMTIEEYLAFEEHLLKQAEDDGFAYDENDENEETD